MWWTAKETEVNSYLIKDWNFESCWNDKEKSFSFHLNLHWEPKWFMHHCFYNVDDDEMKSSWSHHIKAKILNAFEEVSWQNHKKT